jgi:phage terminase large subunit GpA-like protein
MNKKIPIVDVNGDRLALAAIAAGLKPDPCEPMSEWADEHRLLNQTYAAEPGKWRTNRTPYLKEIMDAFSPSSRCEFVTIMKGAQLGFTEALTNMLGYIIHRAPAPTMMVQPTQNLAKRYSKQRLSTMIQDMPVLRGLVADPRARDSGNTTLSKAFDGGVLFIAGANSAADLRSVPVRFLLLDEVDAYPYDLDGEGDPIELAVNRTKTFARRKVLIGSTPTVKDVSRVEREYLKGDQRKYHVKCPHCETMQELFWQNIKWDKDKNKIPRPETAFYMCDHCSGMITESDKLKMLQHGQWVATKPENNYRDTRRSYHISSLYSPWESWANLVQKWIDAQQDPHLLKTFINTALGECWDEESNRQDPNDLRKRAESYPLRTLPSGALIATCGVDVQDNRLEAVIWAFGKDGQESWAIDWHVFFGDPASPKLWAELDEWLQLELDHESGSSVKLSAVAVDTGGHHTQMVYDFCRIRKHRHVIAIKGQSSRNRPVVGRPTNQDITLKGKTIKGGVQLWPVGSDTAKGVWYGRFAIDEGAGRVHFSDKLEDDFFDQITAEKLVTRYVKGHPRAEWVKPSHKRNEVLDCSVYALAAAYHLGMNKWSQKDWQHLEDMVDPITKDLFAESTKIPPKEQKPAAIVPPPGRLLPAKPKSGGSFASRW